ncbi:hypothetical protein Ssi03_05760 [Sphaerisporangium siamense]|nr:hypothetical protein Ssi03_05760 [Sphaerisporangium siamense]
MWAPGFAGLRPADAVWEVKSMREEVGSTRDGRGVRLGGFVTERLPTGSPSPTNSHNEHDQARGRAGMHASDLSTVARRHHKV